VEVVTTFSHDTGAAVVGTPGEGGGWAFLSSGTWSLMGVERAEPLITDRTRELNLTNEAGFGGTVRLLKNISGLWLIQECRRAWAEQGNHLDYATLVELAGGSPAFISLIHPADPCFLAPDDMPARIGAYCREHGEAEPPTPGAVVRCILESLALLYRRTAEELESVTGEKIRRLHIVGGGSQNALLNQFAADALDVPVLAGPVEATAAGNLLVQVFAMKKLSSLAEMRSVIRSSFEIRRYDPRDRAAWGSVYQRFRRLV
jgi:rhamnulokinase